MGIHHSFHLQRAYNLYGLSSLEWVVLETCDKQLVSAREQYWINYYQSYNREFGFNINPNASGGVRSKETVDKIKSTKARHPFKMSESQKQHLSAVFKGKKAWNKGRKATPEETAKNSAARKRYFANGGQVWNKGLKPSDDDLSRLRRQGFQKGAPGFWEGKKRPNISGLNHWRKRKSVSATPSAGSVQTDSAEIVAVRLF